MTILIPVWLLWVLGVIAGIATLILAALGVVFVFFLRDFGRSMNRAWGWW